MDEDAIRDAESDFDRVLGRLDAIRDLLDRWDAEDAAQREEHAA